LRSFGGAAIAVTNRMEDSVKLTDPQLVPLAATQGRDFTNKSEVAGHPGAEHLDIGSDVERLGVDEPADFLSSTQAKNSAPPMGSKAFEPGLRRNLRPRYSFRE
jgi:hypothetical protein